MVLKEFFNARFNRKIQRKPRIERIPASIHTYTYMATFYAITVYIDISSMQEPLYTSVDTKRTTG